MNTQKPITLNFVLYSSYPYYSGGRENWLHKICPLFEKAGYKIKIFTYKNFSKKLIYNIDKGSNIKIFQLPLLVSIPLIGPLIMRKGFETIDWHIFNMYAFFIALFSNKNNTIFLTMGPIHDAIGILIAKLINPNLKFINLIRGLHANIASFERPFLSKYFYFIEKKSIQNADLVICNGVDTKEYVDTLGVNSLAIPNGVDIDKFSKSAFSRPKEMNSKTLFYIVMVASLNHVKGIDDVINVAPLLKEKYSSKIKFILVGKGNSNKYIKKTENLDVKNMFTFTGEKSNVQDYYHFADIALSFNYGKGDAENNNNPIGGGVSMSLLEAMASGSPVIAFNNQIYNKILKNNHSAILIEEKNSREFAEKIESLFNNPAIRLQLGNNALEESKKFDWGIIAKEFINTLEKAFR